MSTTEWHGVYGGGDPTIDEYDEVVAGLPVVADAVQTTALDVPFGALIWAGRTIREQAAEIERLQAAIGKLRAPQPPAVNRFIQLGRLVDEIDALHKRWERIARSPTPKQEAD